MPNEREVFQLSLHPFGKQGYGSMYLAMVNKVLSLSLLHALIIFSSRKAQTSRATIISAVRVVLRSAVMPLKCNTKTSLTG